jgi:hypothetical protein
MPPRMSWGWRAVATRSHDMAEIDWSGGETADLVGVTQGLRLRAEKSAERYLSRGWRGDRWRARVPVGSCRLSREAGGREIGGAIFGKGKGLHRAVCVFSE